MSFWDFAIQHPFVAFFIWIVTLSVIEDTFKKK